MLAHPQEICNISRQHVFLIHTSTLQCACFGSYYSKMCTIKHKSYVRGAPWSAAKRLHGQRTGAFSWRPVLGLSRKTDQFRLDPTLNCAPGWWCDRVSSVYSPHTLEMLRHLPTYDQPPGFVPHAYQTPAPSLPPSNPP